MILFMPFLVLTRQFIRFKFVESHNAKADILKKAIKAAEFDRDSRKRRYNHE
jgi:hypothetical protein